MPSRRDMVDLIEGEVVGDFRYGGVRVKVRYVSRLLAVCSAAWCLWLWCWKEALLEGARRGKRIGGDGDPEAQVDQRIRVDRTAAAQSNLVPVRRGSFVS